ncbi:MAG TPA: hypothetical protein VF676_03585 [Flavobacterium sp.]|jgi:hypothetical protein
MIKYGNRSGKSGVRGYEIATDYIRVLFTGKAAPYKYSYQSAGKAHVEQMKRLAKSGKGLATYISQHVKERYERN